ncbi:hypothetical protein ACT453_58225, partial [Bacillus sp. D-CC]
SNLINKLFINPCLRYSGKVEEELQEKSIFCSYTIARSLSFGMNAAFHQLGYTYTGRLANNCYIFDKLEDRNIGVKDLS